MSPVVQLTALRINSYVHLQFIREELDWPTLPGSARLGSAGLSVCWKSIHGTATPRKHLLSFSGRTDSNLMLLCDRELNTRNSCGAANNGHHHRAEPSRAEPSWGRLAVLHRWPKPDFNKHFVGDLDAPGGTVTSSAVCYRTCQPYL